MPKKQKQKKNKNFVIESASLHPSLPKVPKKKKNKVTTPTG